MDNPKIIRAWTFYDWANSAYSLIITSAIFPAYYSAVAPLNISLLGLQFSRVSIASYSIALSFLIIAILSPLLSSIADVKGNKKTFMKFFCYMGSFACMAMFFFDKQYIGENFVWYGIFCSIIASIGYCGSIVFYNAFLPEIASKNQQDKVSARGFSMGYVGSVILMMLCFAMILLDENRGWQLGTLPARISFLAVGIWWIFFAQITFSALKENEKPIQVKASFNFFDGYKALQHVFTALRKIHSLNFFLASFFFYNMGVQTVMYMATYFASDELHMATSQLLSVVLIIQLVAILGAYLFAKFSNKKGNQIALLSLVMIWIGICVAAYFVQTVTAFYILSFFVGMVMGGIQSLSRSTYSKLLPETNDTASYFSFYDVCEKVGIVIGTLSFGLVADLTGGMRNSTLALSVYFIIGFMLLLRLSNTNFIQKK
jgi:MFS transporter, UMF1 family